MTDRPIIFSAPMVRAMIGGCKTQTRRLATSPLRKVRPGDRLYVRESFARVGGGDPGYPITRADYPACVPAHFENVPADIGEIRWTPSIHMPRAASRLTLIVEDVRFQPLHDISEADALAEGITKHSDTEHGVLGYRDSWNEHHSAYAAFRGLWCLLHKESPSRWRDNPDVVALTFCVICENIDRVAP